MNPDELRAPSPVGVRLALLLSLIGAGVASFLSLGLSPDELWPGAGGLTTAGRFFARAFSPALHSEAQFVPPGTPPLLVIAARAAVTTLLTGAAAMSLGLILGIVLGFLASSAWWADELREARGSSRFVRRTLAPAVCGSTRVAIVLMRSVHELLWAVLFLTAIGLNELAAVIAIAIPTGGVLAKIFSELIDEAPRDAALALRAGGASSLQAYCFGLVPRALPDLIAYAFYRFECVLRSSAVMGFFGFSTLGLHIRQSFSSTSYGEVWTYLYALFILLALFDVWSGAVRRRVLA